MRLRRTPSDGQPLYVQLVRQIQHAVETGELKEGDQLPSIRALAEELVVSPTTVIKAWSELEREGVIELHHGSGAFVAKNRRARASAVRLQAAASLVDDLVDHLRADGIRDDEIRRLFEAALLHPAGAKK